MAKVGIVESCSGGSTWGKWCKRPQAKRERQASKKIIKEEL